MNQNLISLVFMFCFSLVVSSQNSILYMGGIAHLGNGEKIENSVIVVKDGKFDIVADANRIRIDPSAFDTIIKIYGKHVYPAFISPNTTLGMTEIDAVRATKDFDEVGKFNPNVRSLIAYNTDSKILKTVRTNGVLITQATPRGGIISGSSSVMFLDGWNWEDAQLRSDDGIHLNWPSTYNTYGWWAEPGSTSKNKNYKKGVEEIKEYFEIAKSYYQNNTEIDIELEAMKGLFNGTRNLYVNAGYPNEIRESIRYFKGIGVKNVVIVGGKGALDALPTLKEFNIPIILKRVHSLPSNEDAPIDEYFSLPASYKMKEFYSVLPIMEIWRQWEQEIFHLLREPQCLYGLKYEYAISALSLNTSIIFGIDKNSGSITRGKDATFFISSGDALDMIGNNVEYAFIKGKEVNLNNHQKELYEKYKNR